MDMLTPGQVSVLGSILKQVTWESCGDAYEHLMPRGGVVAVFRSGLRSLRPGGVSVRESPLTVGKGKEFSRFSVALGPFWCGRW